MILTYKQDNMRKLLVTGGYGMVGSAIPCDIKFRSQELDLTDYNKTFNFFQKHTPEGVIHCAGKIGGVGANSTKKGEFLLKNTLINTNTIEVSRLVNVKKLVCLLSTCVFPVSAKYPLTPDQIHNGEPHESALGYSYSKRLAEVQIRTYREQYGVNYVSLVPCNIYGPNDNFTLGECHVIPSLIHKCYLAKQNNSSLEVWGDGNSFREFMFSKDVGKISLWALDNYNDKTPLIISPSQEIKIKDLVILIAKIMDFDGEIIFDTTKPFGQYRKPSDNSVFKSLYPNFNFTSIEDGLKETINWFIKNYKNIRK